MSTLRHIESPMFRGVLETTGVNACAPSPTPEPEPPLTDPPPPQVPILCSPPRPNPYILCNSRHNRLQSKQASKPSSWGMWKTHWPTGSTITTTTTNLSLLNVKKFQKKCRSAKIYYWKVDRIFEGIVFHGKNMERITLADASEKNYSEAWQWNCSKMCIEVLRGSTISSQLPQIRPKSSILFNLWLNKFSLEQITK